MLRAKKSIKNTEKSKSTWSERDEAREKFISAIHYALGRISPNINICVQREQNARFENNFSMSMELLSVCLTLKLVGLLAV